MPNTANTQFGGALDRAVPDENGPQPHADGVETDGPAADAPGPVLGMAALLASRTAELWAAATEGARDGGAQSIGFATRVLAGVAGAPGVRPPTALVADDGAGTPGAGGDGVHLGRRQMDDLYACAEACRYGGAPDVGRFGFALAARATADGPRGAPATGDGTTEAAFLTAVGRLHGRSTHAQEDLAADDVTLLGLAEGLAAVRAHHDARGTALAGDASSTPLAATVAWLLALVDGRAPQGWSGRLRALAGDLLDRRGRLLQRIDESDPAAVALDLALRRCWPAAMIDAPHPGSRVQQELMAAILREAAPPSGALELVAVRLAALDALVMQTAAALVPNVGEVARILRATQGALKRWVWEEKPGRQGVAAARWLIDDEAHVQALLWTVLSPHFGPHLRDEEYLPGFGLKQPRSDFGIVTLKLIVEVKIARTPAAFKAIEEEVAGDLGLYFAEPARYDRMLVYVYDDCDAPHPERYESLRVALTQRDARVEDVIVIRRPGMIPQRGARQ